MELKHDPTEYVGTYTRAWYDMMTKIWTDRINLLGIIDTGRLRSSVSGKSLKVDGFDITAAFRFVQYGIYVDAGTGNGYRRGNPGDLPFLDKNYRKLKGLGPARKKQRWFSPSWAISRRVLTDKMGELVGDAFVGVVQEFAQE